MRQKKTRQLIILNSSIVIGDIVLFSKMFLGLSLIGGSPLTLAAAWTAVFVSACAFGVGNTRLLKREETRSLTGNINTLNDCVRVLEASRWIKTFTREINENIEQIRRLRKKLTTINDILLQKFNSNEITYRRFAGVLREVENAVYLNVRSILNKISAFDEEDYNRITREVREQLPAGQESRASELTQEKLQICNEYISFVNHATGDNEQILLKLDKMLLEISRYNSLEGGDLENMSAMKEMDELIKNARLYK